MNLTGLSIDKLNLPLPLISENSTSSLSLSLWWDKLHQTVILHQMTPLWDLMWNFYNSFGTFLSESLRRFREPGGVDWSVHVYSPCYALHAS